MLLDQIKADIQSSLKKGDHIRVETMRFLVAGIRNFAIAKYGNIGEAGVTDADVLDIIKKQVKTHKESVEVFEKAGRVELATKEKQELEILSSFLPKELSDEALKTLLTDVAGGDTSNFGLLMKAAMGKVQGQADGARVSAILKQLLQEKK